MRPNGTRIRDLRNELDLSLRVFEAQTGINRSYLSRLETGQIRSPDAGRLRAVALALGVDIDAITHRGDDVPTEDTTRAMEENELRRWTPEEVVAARLLPYKSARVLRQKCHRREVWHHQDGGRISFTAEDIRRNNAAAQVAPIAA